MKRGLYLFMMFCLFSVCISAQNGERTIVEDLNVSKWGQGDVKVMQDEAIQNKVAVYHDGTIEEPEGGWMKSSSTPIKGGGYKIQIFMGNNQQQSKREAESKQAQISSLYPDLHLVKNFKSPFWTLRVTNIATKEQAEEILKELKKQFPSFGKEMYVVAPNR